MPHKSIFKLLLWIQWSFRLTVECNKVHQIGNCLPLFTSFPVEGNQPTESRNIETVDIWSVYCATIEKEDFYVKSTP